MVVCNPSSCISRIIVEKIQIPLHVYWTNINVITNSWNVRRKITSCHKTNKENHKVKTQSYRKRIVHYAWEYFPNTIVEEKGMGKKSSECDSDETSGANISKIDSLICAVKRAVIFLRLLHTVRTVQRTAYNLYHWHRLRRDFCVEINFLVSS